MEQYEQDDEQVFPEVRERAVRMVLDGEGPHGSRWQAIVSIAAKIALSNMLNDWVKQAGVDNGRRAGVSTDMAAKLKARERENRELRQANEILKASAYFALAELDAGRSDGVVHRCASGMHGVEPICSVLPIAYYSHLAKRADPARQSDRARRDDALRPEILRVFEEKDRDYGVRKVWRQLRREGFDIARCSVGKLMKGWRSKRLSVASRTGRRSRTDRHHGRWTR